MTLRNRKKAANAQRKQTPGFRKPARPFAQSPQSAKGQRRPGEPGQHVHVVEIVLVRVKMKMPFSLSCFRPRTIPQTGAANVLQQQRPDQGPRHPTTRATAVVSRYFCAPVRGNERQDAIVSSSMTGSTSPSERMHMPRPVPSHSPANRGGAPKPPAHRGRSPGRPVVPFRDQLMSAQQQSPAAEQHQRGNPALVASIQFFRGQRGEQECQRHVEAGGKACAIMQGQ